MPSLSSVNLQIYTEAEWSYCPGKCFTQCNPPHIQESEVLYSQTTSGINSVTSTACYVFSWQTYSIVSKSCEKQNIPPREMFSALPKD